MKSIKFILIGLAALVVLGLALWQYYEKATTKVCDDIIFSRVVSQDQAWTATTFIRNCDHVTGDTTVLNIQPTYETFNPERGCLIFIAKGRSYALNVKWVSNTNVQVRQGFPPNNVFKMLDRCLNIGVTHVATNEAENTVPAAGISVVPAQ